MIIQLRIGTSQRLAGYIAAQVHALFPSTGVTSDVNDISRLLPAALERLRPMLEAVRNFTPNYFDHLNSLQYCAFLYLLATEAANEFPGSELADRFFCLNRTLNSIDLYHKVKMPPVFFISHGLGTVIGDATYGNQLVVFQNVTVGRVGTDRPTIGAKVVLFPGASVTGNSIIGDGSVVSAGTRIHNCTVPPETLATMSGRRLLLRPRPRDFLALYLR